MIAAIRQQCSAADDFISAGVRFEPIAGFLFRRGIPFKSSIGICMSRPVEFPLRAAIKAIIRLDNRIGNRIAILIHEVAAKNMT